MIPFEDVILATARACARPLGYVYSGYLAVRIKDALRSDDPEHIIASVGDIDTIGDCKYAIPVTDNAGNGYRITVAVDAQVRG